MISFIIQENVPNADLRSGANRAISVIVVLGLIMSVFTFSAPLQPVYGQNPSFSSAINLSNAAEDTTAQQIAVSGTNVYVVWVGPSGMNNDIFFSRSTDNGATFSTPLNISNGAAHSSEPQIVASGTNVYVIWTGPNGPIFDVFFIRSTDNGATFNTPVNLSNSGNTLAPYIAVSGTNVYIVWIGPGGVSADIFFSRSTDNGATFSTRVNISNNARGAALNAPQVAVSGTNVYLVWFALVAGALGTLEYRISFSASTDNGATFSTPLNITDIAFAGRQQIATSGNNVYVVWLGAGDDGNNETFVSASTDNGATFSTPLNLSNNAGDAELPQIAASGSNVYAVWSEGSTSFDIFFSRSTDNGATFSTMVSISSGVGDSFEAEIAASGSNVYVVWDAGTGPGFDIFFSRSTDNGATFSTPLNVSNSAGESFTPLIAVSGTNLYVVWQDTSSGRIDIFFSASVEVDTDSDGDGIFDNVDTQPNTFSNDFSDAGIGGATTGTITGRGDQILTVTEEPNPAGVSVKADPSGGLIPATISACGGTGLFTLSPDDELVITCGSVTVQVINGTVEITFVFPDNTQATVSLNEANSMTFEPATFSFTVPSTNPDTVVVIIEGEQFSITPGQTIIPFTLNVEPASRTVAQGQSASYDITVNPSQAVSLSISGLPTGSTATFTPNPVTPDGTSILFVSTADTTPSGTYTLNIIATGSVTKSKTVDLIVAPITKQSFMTDSQFMEINSFDSIFTADQSTSSLKLAATNPGTYFYNKIIRNTGTSTITVTVTLNIPASLSPPGPSLPQAFCLKGSNPVHVYGDQGRTIELTSLATISPSQPIANSNSQSLSCVSSASITFTILAGELRYITTHLDFNGKGSTGFTDNAASSYLQGFKFTETVGIGGIPGTIQDVRSFTAVGKRVTAIGGFAIDTNLLAKSALSVRVLSGSTEIGVSPVTLPDGFYFVEVPAGGPYTVQLFNPTTYSVIRSTSVSVANDEYVSVDFLDLNPADPSIEGFVFDSGIQGVADVTVNLYRVTGDSNSLMASTTTSASGWYGFRFTQPGTYTIEIIVPEGYTTSNASVTLTIKQFETLRADFLIHS